MTQRTMSRTMHICEVQAKATALAFRGQTWSTWRAKMRKTKNFPRVHAEAASAKKESTSLAVQGYIQGHLEGAVSQKEGQVLDDRRSDRERGHQEQLETHGADMSDAFAIAVIGEVEEQSSKGCCHAEGNRQVCEKHSLATKAPPAAALC
eukprot:CAMPEP_0180827450 /NCGR_PEP_ID=MMETSP1038_2-20121128/74173_1 /TAXON_ID=632150 /ORGANISM="Azadinium spinosum, Strain 3D9" /LENGTH=149 /DNA_ID=CAMNT_0022870305 /DNA_START=105 /DNA_END=555 /DNA_ORIENTATION=-